MTDAEYLEWLKSESAVKCVLLEVGVSIGGVSSTLYLSNRGYTTAPTDSPANTNYLPVVRGGLEMSSELSLQGDPNISWGDIAVMNYNGERDEWLTYTWKNRDIKVLLGDVTWNRSLFREVFAGKVEDLTSQSRDTLNIKIRDKTEGLNTSLSETKLGGTTTNKEKIIPLCFGECHNIEPLLTNPVTLEYQVHAGAIERFIEVRDNGVPVSFSGNLATGKFNLANSPLGTITASVQGAKPDVYRNTVGSLVKHIAKTYGKYPLEDSEIDLTNFSDFETANPQPVGVYLTEKANVMVVISELAKSVGAQAVMGLDGKLRMLKVALPSASFDWEINPEDIKEKSLTVNRKIDVVAAVSLNYCKNYTVQENLQSALPPEHTTLFAQEWLEANASDTAVATAYGLTEEVEKQPTALLVTSDAQAEAARRLNIYKTQRYVYSLEANLGLMLVSLGQYVKIYNPRFGFSSGKIGQVVSTKVDWFANSVTLEVLA